MKFEYKVIAACAEGELNKLGEQGWELVSSEGDRFTFKREKVASEPPREFFDRPAAPGAPRKNK